jgi:hypothetical protein
MRVKPSFQLIDKSSTDVVHYAGNAFLLDGLAGFIFVPEAGKIFHFLGQPTQRAAVSRASTEDSRLFF